MSALVDRQKQVFKPTGRPDHTLDTGGLARDLTDMGNHVKQTVRVLDVRLSVWADGGFSDGNASYPANFLCDLCRRQNPAFAGFCPLAKLDFEHFHLAVCCNVCQFLVIEVALTVPHTISGGPDLKYHITATVQMIGGQAAFPCIHPAIGHGGPFRQGLNCRPGQRAIAHT